MLQLPYLYCRSRVVFVSNASARSREAKRDMPAFSLPPLNLVVQMASEPMSPTPSLAYPASLCIANESSNGTFFPSVVGM